MRVLKPKLEIPLSSKDLPRPIMFRSARVPADGLYPRHRHAWGEFVYSFSGVMELKVGGQQFLAPPQYGVWLPPDVEHVGLNRREAHHCSVYVARPGCRALPRNACALTVTPLVRALLEHQTRKFAAEAGSPQDDRLLQVLVDQLAQAPCASSYLPHSDDPLLAPVLQALADDPGDNRTLAELAHAAHTTERTLTRRCQRDLGMSFAEWRQRLRVVKALPRLERGHKVESIALDLGYASASAFIVMFRRHMKLTPDEFRKNATSQGERTRA
jgi:AraC-like DNA-binding protein